MADATTEVTTDAAATTDATQTTAQTTAAQTTTDTQTAATTQPAKATTAATTSDTDDAATKPGAWPDDWRDRAAKGDEKRLAKLGRYASPEAALDALFAAQQKLSSGELKTAKPKDNTPEAINEWRKENGIPEKPEEYGMPEGLVIGEVDKPLIDSFIKDMHGANAHPEIVKSAIASYYKLQDQQMAELEERNAEAKTVTIDALREEWGGDYRQNMNMIKGALESMPEALGESIINARTPDGVQLLNTPEFVRWLANVQREINPVATVVPNAGANAGEAIATELSTLTKMMGDRSSDYWKGPNAEKNQARYRDLVKAQERMKK